MNKLTTTIIAASLLAIPFSTYAEDVSLDDMYRYVDSNAYEIVLSSSPRKNIDVTLDDMYRYEDFDHNPTHLNGDEITESSAFSIATAKTFPDVNVYLNY